MSNPMNKVPFPFVGDGTAVLRYRTADLVTLEQKYGLGFTEEITRRLSSNSHECLVACMQVGLKREDGRKTFAGVDFDDLPFSIYDAAPLVFHAISVAITGQSYAEILSRQEEAERPAADPPPGSEMAGSFNESFEPDTPQGS